MAIDGFASPESVLEVRGLTKRFFGMTVVDNVSFVVRPGDVVGCLGPNGSGKTTAIRMIVGLLEPSAGTASFGGRSLDADLTDFRRHLGYVPEEPQLYPFLSGRQYLELVGRLRGIQAALLEWKISTLVALFGLSDASEMAISSYSKGMKQKVLVIAALLHDPALVIFDEPESGLDVGAMLVMRRLVSELARRGKTVLYSSHAIDLVEKVSTRVLVMNRGKIVADDTVSNLRSLETSASLEEVFSRLAPRSDPGQVASDIVDVAGLKS